MNNIANRIRFLEQRLGLHRDASDCIRTAGKSPTEVQAEFLCRLILAGGVESAEALIVVASTPNWRTQVSDLDKLPDGLDEMIDAIHWTEKTCPGLPSRILAAFKENRPITEVDVFPNGREPRDQSYSYRQGKRIHWPLDQIYGLSNC
jgi:hypothetical protein